MAFLVSAKWSWWALKFFYDRQQEISRARKRGIVVVVTGATGGLGLATVKAICSRLTQIPSHQSHTVILTSRSHSKGRSALEYVRHPTVQVAFHPLDLCDAQSIAVFSNNLISKFENIDVLVNYAGIFPSATRLDENVDARQVMAVNYYGTKAVIAALMPLMSPTGRVVTAASSLAELAIRSMKDETYTKVFSPESTEKDIDGAVESFVEEVCTLNSEHHCVRNACNALIDSFAQAARIAITQHLGGSAQSAFPDGPKDVTLCSFSPGWCRTPSGGPRAPFSAEEGAEEAVYAVFDADPKEIQGSFLIARKPSRFGNSIPDLEFNFIQGAHGENTRREEELSVD